MNNSDEERGIIESILDYTESGATYLEPEIMQIPVRQYTDPQHLAHEVDVLFRQFPIVLGHASQLAEPGQFLTHDTTGVPILVTRTHEGSIKAFLNVCRHRGARVESRACGHARTLSCPYHGWTYGMDGALRGIRKPRGFGEIDKASLGLVELPVFQRFGLIWVRPTPTEEPIDIDAWLAPMAEQLASLHLESHVVYREWVLERKMNWHIALEGFQEQYHFCSAHKHSACSSYLDTQGVFVDKYPHFRHAVPLTGITKLKELPAEAWSYRKNFMTQNYLFPCNYAQVMTDHVYIHTIVPTGVSSCIFQCMMLIPEPAESEKARKHWDANYDVVRRVFDEDFVIGEGIQSGLATGANHHFTIGRYESGLHLAHKALDDALAGRLTA